jgi:predicted nucleic acid-binding Zn ribbon protein
MLTRVPWLRAETKPKPRPLKKDRRDHLIAAVADILRQGAPTAFSFEASCRHGLRAAFCLYGWTWAEADATAADILAAAIRKVGARRPTWQEGQPEWTQYGILAIERTTCIRCKAPLPEGHWKYCSMLCAQADKQARLRARRAEEMLAYQRARYAAGKLHPPQPPRPCEVCGKSFSPRKKTARFCSYSCSNKRRGHAWRKPLFPR